MHTDRGLVPLGRRVRQVNAVEPWTLATSLRWQPTSLHVEVPAAASPRAALDGFSDGSMDESAPKRVADHDTADSRHHHARIDGVDGVRLAHVVSQDMQDHEKENAAPLAPRPRGWGL